MSQTIAQLQQRDRATHVILRWWVTLQLNFRLEGCVSRQFLWTVRWVNGYTLLLEVFTQRNFDSMQIEFYKKKQKIAF